jgi:hypothetical protein
MIKKYIKILLAINMVMIGFFSLPALANQGLAAIAKMNHEELILLKKVNTIQRGMSYEQVVTILGKPDREAVGIRPTWRVQGNPVNHIAVYFKANGVFNVRWISMGRFVYEPLRLPLKPPAHKAKP